MSNATEIENLERQVIIMENTDRLGYDGIQELGRLKRELANLKAEAENADTNESQTEEKRALIQSQGGRFTSITFIKADGTLRQMRLQPASLKFHVKGDAATDAGRKGAETRAIHHPNLMPVWDADKKSIRTVNLETVTRIAVGGQVHEFAA